MSLSKPIKSPSSGILDWQAYSESSGFMLGMKRTWTGALGHCDIVRYRIECPEGENHRVWSIKERVEHEFNHINKAKAWAEEHYKAIPSSEWVIGSAEHIEAVAREIEAAEAAPVADYTEDEMRTPPSQYPLKLCQ